MRGGHSLLVTVLLYRQCSMNGPHFRRLLLIKVSGIPCVAALWWLCMADAAADVHPEHPTVETKARSVPFQTPPEICKTCDRSSGIVCRFPLNGVLARQTQIWFRSS